MSSENMNDNYVKLGLLDGTVLKAEHLNHIEEGIDLAFRMASIKAGEALGQVAEALETANSAVESANNAVITANLSVKSVNGSVPNEKGDVDITEAVNDAIAQAKASGEFDGPEGPPGEDGNGIKSAVLNADYTLTLTFDDGTTYTTPSIRGATGSAGKDGSNGKDGTSVTVKSVSESSADGGSNVVTFSDGKTITIKNGSQGLPGPAGPAGDRGPEGEVGRAGVDGVDGITPHIGDNGNWYIGEIDTGKPSRGVSGSAVVDIIPETTLTLDEYAGWEGTTHKRITVGNTYLIFIDGVEYEREAMYDEGFECPYIGNIALLGDDGHENANDDIFYFAIFNDGAILLNVTYPDYANRTIALAVQEIQKNDGVQSNMAAAEGEPGHVLHRTHYSEYVATLADNLTVTSGLCSWINYNAIKDYTDVTVVYDGTVYHECPITVVKSSDGDYFHIGNFQDSAPEYPFYIYGYLANDVSTVNVGEGSHTISVKLSKVAKKIDKKYLPDDIGGGVSSWNDLPDKPTDPAWREIANSVETSEYSMEVGYFCFRVFWDTYITLDSAPETISVMYDGVLYEDLKTTTIPGMGDLTGNLYYLNAMLGTSFENTGEPFICTVLKTNLHFITLDATPTAHTVRVSTYCKPGTTLPFVDLTKYIENIEGSVELDIADDDYAENVYWKLKQHDTVMLKVKIAESSSPQTVVAHPIHSQYSPVYVRCFVYDTTITSARLLSLDIHENKVYALAVSLR